MKIYLDTIDLDYVPNYIDITACNIHYTKSVNKVFDIVQDSKNKHKSILVNGIECLLAFELCALQYYVKDRYVSPEVPIPFDKIEFYEITKDGVVDITDKESSTISKTDVDSARKRISPLYFNLLNYYEE